MIIENKKIRTKPIEIAPVPSLNTEEIKKSKTTLPIINRIAIEIYLPIKNLRLLLTIFYSKQKVKERLFCMLQLEQNVDKKAKIVE